MLWCYCPPIQFLLELLGQPGKLKNVKARLVGSLNSFFQLDQVIISPLSHGGHYASVTLSNSPLCCHLRCTFRPLSILASLTLKELSAHFIDSDNILSDT